MDRSQWWFYAAIEDACLPPRPCCFSLSTSFSLPPAPFVPLPFPLFLSSLSSSLSYSSAARSSFLSLTRSSQLFTSLSHARTHTAQLFHRTILSLSLSFPFMFHSFVLVHRSPIRLAPFVTNRATLHERQRVLLVKPLRTFSYIAWRSTTSSIPQHVSRIYAPGQKFRIIFFYIN